MFITSDIIKNKTQSRLQAYKTGYVLPILACEEILSLNTHQSLISQLQELVAIPEHYFEALYLSTINNYAEYVQVLPAQMNGALCGLLNQGLARASLVTSHYIEAYGNTDPLYNYAVFTAGLLRDVSKTVINQKIFIVDSEGNYLEEWCPFTKSLIGQGEYYKIYPTAPAYLRLQHSITPLIARQIMPTDGFLWLARNPNIFADWLDALRGDANQGGRIARTLELVRDEEALALAHSFAQIPIEMKESVATQHAEAFYNWLIEGLINGEIKVNTTDAQIHRVEDGVFVSREAIKRFVDVNNGAVSLNVVLNELGNMLGIAKKGSGEFHYENFYSENVDAKERKNSSLGGPLATIHQRTVREGIILNANMVYHSSLAPGVTNVLKAAQTKVPASHQLPAGIEPKKEAPAIQNTPSLPNLHR